MTVTEHDVLQQATRLVAATYPGDRGTRAYDEFEIINRDYFDNVLPWPLITWALTAHERVPRTDTLGRGAARQPAGYRCELVRLALCPRCADPRVYAHLGALPPRWADRADLAQLR
jgi:hypothetical protein